VRIPYVIDNQKHRLADVLRYLLDTQSVQAMDIATAYFSVRGYEQLADRLQRLSSFRLLLGAEVSEGADLGLIPLERQVRGLLTADLNQEPFDEATMELIRDLIRFLARPEVAVRLYYGGEPEATRRRHFLHAKAYLLYGGQGGQRAMFDRMYPLVGIVGSSNFTGPGLTTNRELNTVHKVILEEDEA